MKMVPPNNIEAEQAVLGSMMMKKSAVADAAELLNRSDFTGMPTASSLKPC